MSTTLEDILRDQLVTYLISRAITCPVTGAVLDARTCVTFTDADGDPAYVVSPEGWEAIKTNTRGPRLLRGSRFHPPRELGGRRADAHHARGRHHHRHN